MIGPAELRQRVGREARPFVANLDAKRIAGALDEQQDRLVRRVTGIVQHIPDHLLERGIGDDPGIGLRRGAIAEQERTAGVLRAPFVASSPTKAASVVTSGFSPRASPAEVRMPVRIALQRARAACISRRSSARSASAAKSGIFAQSLSTTETSASGEIGRA